MVSGLCLFSFLLFVSFILILLPPYFISRLVYSFISLLFYWSLTSSSFLASYINDFLFLSLFIIFIHYCFYFWGGIPFFFLVSWVETLLVFRLVSGKVLAGDRVVWRVWWRNYLQRCGHLYPPWAWRGRAAVTEGQGDTWSNAPLSDIRRCWDSAGGALWCCPQGHFLCAQAAWGRGAWMHKKPAEDIQHIPLPPIVI